jgi:uncharacterized membrane protein YhaH (DUF805 family)
VSPLDANSMLLGFLAIVLIGLLLIAPAAVLLVRRKRLKRMK